MQKIREHKDKHVRLWTDKGFVWAVFIYAIFLAFSVVMTYVASEYVDGYIGGEIVPDLLLDHIPIYNVGYMFFQGSFFFIISLLCIGLFLPEATPFTLASTALFFGIRAIFMTLTHLSAPNIEYYNYISYRHDIPEIIFSMNSGNDLFFSGHAGFPFLLALIFWNYKLIRYYLLLCSAIASVVVIIGHLHYSIDVFSAFFIAYGIFEMSKVFFKGAYKQFSEVKVRFSEVKVK